MLFGKFLKTKHMAKYIKTTAKNAVQKGLINGGDKVWVEALIEGMDESGFYTKDAYIYDSATIRIPKPEPKPIDFGVAGRVLKCHDAIVMTTGLENDRYFSGYVLESNVYDKGFTSNSWIIENKWQDITDTYKP